MDWTEVNPVETSFRIIASMDEGIFISEIGIGNSIDNLVPGVPQNLTAEIDEENIILSWNPNSELDLDYYGIYKSTDENFDPSAFEQPSLFAAENMYLDEDVENGIYYYSITAFDVHGNESLFSIISYVGIV